MISKIFIDSDVIIDFLTDRVPFAEFSSTVFELSEKGLLELFTSALCITNVYYVTRKILGDKKARLVIEELMDLIDVLDVSKQNIQNGLKSEFKDFEDAVQHDVARRNKNVESIITRNIKDYKKAETSVFSPENFLILMNGEFDK